MIGEYAALMCEDKRLQRLMLRVSGIFCLAVGIGIFVPGTLGCPSPGRFIVSLQEREVQALVDSHFPLREKELIFEIRLDSPSVLFSKNNNVEIGMKITALVAQLPVADAKAVVSGKIRYDKDRYEFVLTNPHLGSLDLSHVPSKYTDPVRNAVDRVANRVLPAIPVYKLDPQKHRLEQILLKRAWVSDKKMVTVHVV